ncbi:inositol monophosphatase family protein [uncultured Cyclobacterium sp.]|uniref:3'(2'),5'-bisphosphate nucleotidase CysQ family protein n=1 Tax=uncultured Cyclobacterium sp. TaxID=453820 RepID=UPI0030EE5CDC|tara:strand:+ start:14940 stop:15821 length:882 start_codon:yes stop_codon:yes gene_type:complete
MLEKTNLTTLCQQAINASIEAGKLIQSQVDQSYSQQKKQGGYSTASQVVTEVDFKAQEIILHHLLPSIKQFDLGLLTEEATDDASRLQKDYFWCIDPLDGTLPFTEQRPGYAVSIALVSRAGNSVVGAVYIPDEDLCYSAIKGEGVALNGQSFSLSNTADDDSLHVYMDRSLQGASYFQELKGKTKQWAEGQNLTNVFYHVGFGAVRNALSVLSHSNACYFKFPRKEKGGGSIWDFAATRLIFEELGLPVSNSKRENLHLNSPESTFMNQQGVLYASAESIREMISQLNRKHY